ncbi:hypothetical protein [Hyphomicrobium sp.]|uniref:hypothetical protein n=1 Tax=Hyphomicrobium sp. TaxID=82 RepID=UPI002D764AEC|nr:hypothetical protein [Hyphomicrobium sp.]HET6388165.1 hypothetical protein [Hyphomicrobium sp.]
MRRLILVTGMLAAVAAAASTNVFSMEEQRGVLPGGVAVPDAPKAQEQDAAGRPKAEGTEIRIPGLGKIGTLPKMDFGLDLLYGAAEDTNRASDRPEALPDDQKDLTIHGSVKHRF